MTIQPLEQFAYQGNDTYTFTFEPEGIHTLPGIIPTYQFQFFTREPFPQHLDNTSNTTFPFCLIHFDHTKPSLDLAIDGICGEFRYFAFRQYVAGDRESTLYINIDDDGLHLDIVQFKGHKLAPYFNGRYGVTHFEPPFSRSLANAADRALADWIKLHQ